MNYGERVVLDRSGELLVAVPLYVRAREPLENMNGFRISLEQDAKNHPTWYAVCADGTIWWLVDNEWRQSGKMNLWNGSLV